MHPVRYAAAAPRWVRKMVGLLRELRTHEQEVLSARDLLVRELRANAEVCRQYHAENLAIQTVQDQLSVERWDQFATGWSALRRRHTDLWNEVADAYEGFARTKKRQQPPPDHRWIENIATRLQEARL